MSASVSMCVCVYVKERERRGREEVKKGVRENKRRKEGREMERESRAGQFEPCLIPGKCTYE